MTLFYKISHFFCNCLYRLFYRHRVYGLENIPDGAGIFAANHQSYFDPPIVGISYNKEISFLARSSLFDWPIFGWMIRNLNAIPIAGNASDLSSMKAIIRMLKNEKKVLIFPEGMRTSGEAIQNIKPGVALIALRTGAPIIPTYILGTYNIWPRHKKFPKLWGKTGCVFGKPIYPADYQHLSKNEAQAALSQAIGIAITDLMDESGRSGQEWT